jgi:S-formylglutathione hydrolase FrmB
MKKIYLIFILGWTTIFSQSSVLNVFNTTFFSTSLNQIKNIQVILPPGYDDQDTTNYPVIYFLHGILSDHSSYNQMATVLSNLYSSNSISKYIIVKPDGSTGPYLGSFYSNSELYGKFEDYIINDVIEYIEAEYKVRTGRENRFLSGHSMGGFGALKLAFSYPDKFAAVASHSGPVDFNNFDAQLPYLLRENGSSAPYIYAPQNGGFTLIFYTMAGAFSPNLNVQYLVDLPIDQDGLFIDSTLSKWMKHNPSGLVKELNGHQHPAIYFDCGTLDELGLFIHNTGLRDTLDILGLPYTFYSYSGFHTNKVPERLEVSFKFIDSVYRSTIASVDPLVQHPVEFRLEQNYPNPFNPITIINIFMPAEEYLSLKVYDLLGKEVDILAEGKLPAGIHRFSFDGSSLSNGVYFCRMEAGDNIDVIKMVLLK